MADKLKVLVIDDETAIREMFQVLLESWGYAVDTAPTGAAGLELFRRGAYPVVLTDYLMPGLTGVEVAVELRRHAPTVQVILVTGSAPDEQLDAARRMQLIVLRKPVRLETLKVAVDRAAAPRGTQPG